MAKKKKKTENPAEAMVLAESPAIHAIHMRFVCLHFWLGRVFGAEHSEFRSLAVGALTHGGGRRSRPNKMKHIFYTNREEAAASAASAAAGCIKIRMHLPRSKDAPPGFGFLWRSTSAAEGQNAHAPPATTIARYLN